MKKLSVILTTVIAFLIPINVNAGEAENILVCIKAVKDFSGKNVAEFDVRYTGRILGMRSAEWKGVKCSVKLGYIDNLTVDRKNYIVDGFAGIEAKRTFDLLEKETDEAVSLLESRVELLKGRLEEARAKLRLPNPDISSTKERIRDGISRATGD